MLCFIKRTSFPAIPFFIGQRTTKVTSSAVLFKHARAQPNQVVAHLQSSDSILTFIHAKRNTLTLRYTASVSKVNCLKFNFC